MLLRLRRRFEFEVLSSIPRLAAIEVFEFVLVLITTVWKHRSLVCLTLTLPYTIYIRRLNVCAIRRVCMCYRDVSEHLNSD